MSPRLKTLATTFLAFGFGCFAVLAASCLQVDVTPRADAQSPLDATTPDTQRPADARQAVDQGTVDEIQAPPFSGQIVLFAGNWAPRGWAFCNGQVLNIVDHQQLFAVIGTTYGGDGRTTFALPDLRGRAPVHFGQGPGLSDRRLGEKGGHESVTLDMSHLPRHSHALMGSTNTGNLTSPSGNALAAHTGAFSGGSAGMNAMASSSVAEAGGSEPHSNMPPYVAMNYIIALGGAFPARN